MICTSLVAPPLPGRTARVTWVPSGPCSRLPAGGKDGGRVERLAGLQVLMQVAGQVAWRGAALAGNARRRRRGAGSGAGTPAARTHCIQRQRAGGLPVDRHDFVARPDAGALRGAARRRRDHHQRRALAAGRSGCAALSGAEGHFHSHARHRAGSAPPARHAGSGSGLSAARPRRRLTHSRLQQVIRQQLNSHPAAPEGGVLVGL